MTGQGDKRACKWCGGGMEGKIARAVFCCVKCVNASYSRANAERIAERKRGYREANAERIAEYQREYREANAEKIAEQRREYYQENAEKIAEYYREYYQENVERIAERQREYLNNRIAAASTLSLAHTISQIRGDLTNGTHEPE